MIFFIIPGLVAIAFFLFMCVAILTGNGNDGRK